MPIPDANKLDVWFRDDQDALDVQMALISFIEQFPGTAIYGISGTPYGMNISGHAPRPVIEFLIASQDALVIRVEDHAVKEVA